MPHAVIDGAEGAVNCFARAVFHFDHSALRPAKFTNDKVHDDLASQCSVKPFVWRLNNVADAQMRKTFTHGANAGVDCGFINLLLIVWIENGNLNADAGTAGEWGANRPGITIAPGAWSDDLELVLGGLIEFDEDRAKLWLHRHGEALEKLLVDLW